LKNCLKLPEKTEKECEKVANDCVVDAVKELCKDDKDCLKAMTDGIKDGKVPMTGEVYLKNK